MLKKLHFLRHAKSSWDHGSLSDVERPLNKRGLLATRIMAEPMVEAGCSFKNIFTSPAVRACTTLENIASHLPRHDIKWKIDDDLYTFNAGALLDWCHALSSDLNDVMVVGHNPAITELTNRLTGADIINVPTCAYIQMEFEGDWKDLDKNSAKHTKFLTPKMVKR